MKKTDRQQVIDYFVERDLFYEDPIDLLVYLARDQQKQIPGLPKEYVNKILTAGYRSELTNQLVVDIKKAVNKPADSVKEN